MKVTVNTIKNITPEQLSGMTKAQIKELLKPASLMVAERMQRFEKNNITSPAERRMKEHGKIRVSGTRGEMIKELTTARRFLMSSTSTITGAKQYMKTTREVLGLKGTKMTKEDWSKLWEIIGEAKESTRGIGSKDTQQIVTERFIENRNKKITRKDKEELIKQMSDDFRLKEMARDIRVEDISHDKYTLYQSLLDIQREYERTTTAPRFFKVRK